MVSVTGNVAAPVSAEAVIWPSTPTLTVATANTPVPVLPGTLTMPSLLMVAASATISGTGEVEADSSSVFSPITVPGASALAQFALISALVGSNGPVGVTENT